MTMRRGRNAIGWGILVTAVLAAAALTVNGSAQAAPERVYHLTSTGPFASAIWHFRAGSTRTDAFVFAATGNEVVTGDFAGVERDHGTTVFFDLQLSDLDADGNVTGGIDTFGFLAPFLGSTGYSATFDPLLRTASAGATGVPATRCSYGADGLYTHCDDTTVNLNAAWTGYGPIFRGADATISNDFGLLFVFKDSGSFRQATASATIAGTTLPTIGNAVLARDAESDVFTCIGRYC
jgi:hypothetical protein